MSALPISFDTLTYARKLEQAGFTRDQAEVQASAMREIIEDKLATKADLERVRLELQRDIEIARANLEAKVEITKAELKTDIEKVRSEIHQSKLDTLKWMVGCFIALAAIMAKGFGWIGF